LFHNQTKINITSIN